MNDKRKRYILILLAVGVLATSSIACDDTGDVQSESYEIVQDTQNTIKDAGQVVKDSGLNTDAPTLREVWDAIP